MARAPIVDYVLQIISGGFEQLLRHPDADQFGRDPRSTGDDAARPLHQRGALGFGLRWQAGNLRT